MLILTAMDNHDSAYRLLFSHPEMIRDLLLGFIPGDWVHELDMSTLEKVNGSYITDDIRSRSDDVIWRVRWGKSWVYVYILLEFQSSQERFMAVRLLAYIALLWQDLIRTGQLDPDGKLPPTLPIVLYNGEQRWRAPLEIRQLIGHGPKALSRYLPTLQYLLLDEGAFSEEQLEPLRNLVAAVFRLENSRGPEDIQRVLGHLIDWLGLPEQSGLRRSLAEWVRRIIIPRRLPPDAHIPAMQDIQEVHSMLAERIQQWYDEGEQKGLLRGERTLLTRQLVRRFGPLPDAIQAYLESATAEQLETWSDRILDAKTLDDVFTP